MVAERERCLTKINMKILAANYGSANRSEFHARFSAEVNKAMMSPQEYRAMMRCLNQKQMEVVRFHRKWCKEAIFALKHNHAMPQYKLLSLIHISEPTRPY